MNHAMQDVKERVVELKIGFDEVATVVSFKQKFSEII